MKRHTSLARLRKVLNSCHRRMAEFLNVSPSTYIKAEVHERGLSTAALIRISPLRVAFEITSKENRFPLGMFHLNELILKNHTRHLRSRLAHLKKERERLSLSLRYIKENWLAGSEHLTFLLNLKSRVPESDPCMAIVEEGIEKLQNKLRVFSPDQQMFLEQYINSLTEQERCLKGMLGKH